MKNILIISIIYFSFNSAFCQTKSEKLEYAEVFSIFNFSLSGSNSVIEQYNDFNDASLKQVSDNADPIFGYSSILQYGNYNKASINLADNGNVNTIGQYGNYNSAYINQVSGTSSTGNLGVIYQYLQNNSASITQTGSNNKSYIGQAGVGNNASATVSGNNNNTGILQLGNNNTASQDITGDSKGYLILQMGNNNTFSQIGSNEAVSGYKIYQTGSGMNLKILNGRY